MNEKKRERRVVWPRWLGDSLSGLTVSVVAKYVLPHYNRGHIIDLFQRFPVLHHIERY